MKIGVFVPIGNNGWLISTHAPQYMPTFELNKAIGAKSGALPFRFRPVDDQITWLWRQN
ncbi:monooxygenase ycdM [Escherichia coli]|uniref:Monooxygenase ycdM n=1 Tax=Escherichia coli TaxID=562 RepID=A0A377ASQ7_ECOLX|nr:monooxygenase ycdM [Escherichia coli]